MLIFWSCYWKLLFTKVMSFIDIFFPVVGCSVFVCMPQGSKRKVKHKFLCNWRLFIVYNDKKKKKNCFVLTFIFFFLPFLVILHFLLFVLRNSVKKSIFFIILFYYLILFSWKCRTEWRNSVFRWKRNEKEKKKPKIPKRLNEIF